MNNVRNLIKKNQDFQILKDQNKPIKMMEKNVKKNVEKKMEKKVEKKKVNRNNVDRSKKNSKRESNIALYTAMVPKLSTPEDIQRWREERKKNFPTLAKRQADAASVSKATHISQFLEAQASLSPSTASGHPAACSVSLQPLYTEVIRMEKKIFLDALSFLISKV